MANEGRFLNKRFTVQDGFAKGTNGDSPAMFFEGDTGIVNRPFNVEGLITATMGIVGSFTTGPLKVQGNITATAMTLNAATAGSMTITNLLAGSMTGTAAVLATAAAGSANFDNVRLGASAGNNLITAAWRTIYTWNMGALPGIVGSTNAVITQDVAMSGAAIGDVISAAPIGSIGLDLHWGAMCYTAGAVQIRAWYTGSTGAYTPGQVPFKIACIKI